MNPLLAALVIVALSWAALAAGDRPAPTGFLTVMSVLLLVGTLALSI